MNTTKLTAPEILAAVEDGTLTKAAARDELRRRGNAKYLRRLTSTTRTPKAAPAPKPSRLIVAGTGKANTQAHLVKPAPKATPKASTQPTGRGSKGGNPEKAAAWDVASAIAQAEGVAIRSAEFWATYKAIRATQRQTLVVALDEV